MLDLFDNPNKIGNLKLCLLVVFLSSNEEFEEKKTRPNRVIGRLTSVRKIFVDYSIKYEISPLLSQTLWSHPDLSPRFC